MKRELEVSVGQATALATNKKDLESDVGPLVVVSAREMPNLSPLGRSFGQEVAADRGPMLSNGL